MGWMEWDGGECGGAEGGIGAFTTLARAWPYF